MTFVRNIQIRDPMPLNFAKGKWAGLRRDGQGDKNKCEYPDGRGMQGVPGVYIQTGLRMAFTKTGFALYRNKSAFQGLQGLMGIHSTKYNQA